MLKGCKKPADIKTQSVIVTQTNDIQYGYQTTKNSKFFNNDLNGKKAKKNSSYIHNDLYDTK